MYKMDLVLNNLQWLICLKTKPNQTKKKQKKKHNKLTLYQILPGGRLNRYKTVYINSLRASVVIKFFIILNINF